VHPFLIAVAIILTTYIGFVVLLMRGWLKAMKIKLPPSPDAKFISVIVPVRNEENTIIELLKSIQRTGYSNYEVIVVDDHSTDQTAAVVKKAIQYDQFFRCISNDGVGKKQAIATGVAHASGEIVATTDGDCEVRLRWLQQINECFQSPATKMVFGGVSLRSNNLFGELQELEFSSLIGSGIALWAWGKPVMCNGANLAFRKDVFRELNGYEGNDHIASGDDEFLMRKILQRYPEGMSFINHPDGVVRTNGVQSIRAFFGQRFRWAGKWKHNQSTFAKVLAVFILIVQLALISSFVLLLTSPGRSGAILLLALLAARFITESILLSGVCGFLRVRWQWGALIALQFIYPFYVVGTGLFSNLIAVKWKDRKI
jgi:poly-beta-1,6-N-acetyl-D-glucosamine synthase